MSVSLNISKAAGSLQSDLEVETPLEDINPWNDPKNYPEGGTRAWLTVAGASACLFVSLGWANCNGIFQDYYRRHQLKEYTESDVAWVSSLQVFFLMFGGPFVGKLFDIYGPHCPLAVGSILHVTGLMMASISKEYYQLILSQAVCSSIGASMVYYPAITCTSMWFFRKRGTAMGMITVGAAFGGVILPIVVIHLIPQVGYGWTMRVCAFLILTLLIIANLTIRSRFRPVKRPFKLATMIKPLNEPAFAYLTVAVFFFYSMLELEGRQKWHAADTFFSSVAINLPFTYIVVEARSHGMPEKLADYLVPILNAASIPGRIIPNMIGDRVGRFNMAILMGLLTTIAILGIWLPVKGQGPSIAFTVLYGITSGALIGLIPVACAQISPIEDIGVRTGTALGAGAIGSLIGPPLGGLMIVKSGGSFQGMIVFAGLSCGASVLSLFAARVALVKWRVRAVV